MKQLLTYLQENKSLVYKGFLSLFTIFLIIYLFPKGLRFKYEFRQGETWQYENFYAPFDFSIEGAEKTTDEAEAIEKLNIPDYFRYNPTIANDVAKAYTTKFNTFIKDSTLTVSEKDDLRALGQKMLDKIYEFGVISSTESSRADEQVNLIKKDEVILIDYKRFVAVDNTEAYVKGYVKDRGASKHEGALSALFKEVIRPNVFIDDFAKQEALRKKRADTPKIKKTIEKGAPIVFKGEKIEGEKYILLSTLKTEYELRTQGSGSRYWSIIGYILILVLILLMLFLFLKKYKYDIYSNNNKVTFIFFNIILMILLTTIVVKYDAKYVYVVPLCILPLSLKAFFDARSGLFIHILVVLMLGFIVPNSFEYMLLQIVAGIISVQTISELHRRANLFISVGQITLAYIIIYFAFNVVREGNLSSISWLTFGFFILNGLITLFAQPLVYIYEKIFGLVSDVSLLELSHTNSKLLKRLSNEAPGTFHHSMQVANLAEAVANALGANAMLIRVGALYHDIGKLKNPAYFTENQVANVNPHDALDPLESARIIIDHVLEGIEMAKKNKLPDRIIDFIRTHHGTSLVYYFYKKKSEQMEDVNADDFRYPGPIPFSKEMAIVMICDSVEAASKSLKTPTYPIIDDFVEKIVNKQVENRQFLDADITFREIEIVKEVLKKKLTNIYHLRVEYPE